MENQKEIACSNCGQPTKIIPAGVSRKTGRAYASFYKCKNCQNSESLGVKPTNAPTPAPTALKQPVSSGSDDFKDELRGKLNQMEGLLKLIAKKVGADKEEIDSQLPF